MTSKAQAHLERPVSFTTAARKVAALRDHSSRVGGWIYDSNGRPIVQGWDAYGRRLADAGVIAQDPERQGGNGKWFVNIFVLRSSELIKADHLWGPTPENEPAACAECGHLHFLGVDAGYSECPVDGCDCRGQEWAAAQQWQPYNDGPADAAWRKSRIAEEPADDSQYVELADETLESLEHAGVQAERIAEMKRTRELRSEFERFARRIESGKTWIGGDTTVALNSLGALGAEMIAFAEQNGSPRDFAVDLAAARKES